VAAWRRSCWHQRLALALASAQQLHQIACQQQQASSAAFSSSRISVAQSSYPHSLWQLQHQRRRLASLGISGWRQAKHQLIL